MTALHERRVVLAGVIAAGRGERLQAAGFARPTLKPLVRVGGRALIDRVLASIAEVSPHQIAVIVNEDSLAVKDHVSASTWPFEIRWIVETTPSSMHSFLRVIEALAAAAPQAADPFLISTVDTIAPAGAYRSFADAAHRLDVDVALAVTREVDDEKPLLVTADAATGRVTAFNGGPWATAGYYSVRPSVRAEADAARSDGLTALRQFLARLLANGYRVGAVEVPAGIDVDRPYDVSAAEKFLKQVSA